MVERRVSKICFVIAPGKSDILKLMEERVSIQQPSRSVVQPRPAGLCDALFQNGKVRRVCQQVGQCMIDPRLRAIGVPADEALCR
jgi:hypothetical protein